MTIVEVQTVKLNNGVEIPILGFAVFRSPTQPNVKEMLLLWKRPTQLLMTKSTRRI